MSQTRKATKFLILEICFLALIIKGVEPLGRFIKPPSRSSIWRFPEFKNQNPPVNYDDNALICGYVRQSSNPGLECGVCGDAFKDPVPRDNEIGGKYYQGIITGQYKTGQVIEVQVEINQNHKGFMEWRLCPNPKSENQACFNQHLLLRADGQGSQVEVHEVGIHKTKLKLPEGITCSHCIIQWNYRNGHEWGECDNGTSSLGCGPQKNIRGCSDISIS